MQSTSPRPRRIVRGVLVGIFLVLPLLEILGIIGVSRLIGGWATFGLLLLVGLLGAYIVKREGLRSWRTVSAASRSGQVPGGGLADSALILVGGLLLLVPGFITDLIGLTLLLPVTRPLARAALGQLIVRRVGVPVMAFGSESSGRAWDGPGRSTDQPGAGTTVRGTVIDD